MTRQEYAAYFFLSTQFYIQAITAHLPRTCCGVSAVSPALRSSDEVHAVLAAAMPKRLIFLQNSRQIYHRFLKGQSHNLPTPLLERHIAVQYNSSPVLMCQIHSTKPVDHPTYKRVHHMFLDTDLAQKQYQSNLAQFFLV